MTVCVNDALTVTVDRHDGTLPHRHDGDGDGAQERQKNVTVTAFRSTVTVMTERCDGDGDAPPPSPSQRERPAMTLAAHRSDEGKNVPMTVINNQPRTVTVTGADQLSVIDELRTWLVARSETVTLVSLTLADISWNGEVHAIAVVTERAQQATVTIASLSPATPTERPSWLTDELLTGDAQRAMFVYLDHNPDTPGADLTRWAQRHFTVNPNYGHKIRNKWLNRRSKAGRIDTGSN